MRNLPNGVMYLHIHQVAVFAWHVRISAFVRSVTLEWPDKKSIWVNFIYRFLNYLNNSYTSLTTELNSWSQIAAIICTFDQQMVWSLRNNSIDFASLIQSVASGNRKKRSWKCTDCCTPLNCGCWRGCFAKFKCELLHSIMKLRFN